MNTTNFLPALPVLRLASLSTQIKRAFSPATRLFSEIMGCPFTTGETLRILRAMLAGACLLFPVEMPLWLRALFLLWTAAALYSCRDLKTP